MARQDIQVDDRGELETVDNIVGKTVYGFRLLGRMEGMDNDRYAYGEITVPRSDEKRVKEGFQLHAFLPYAPQYKELQIRFRLDAENPEYILNRATNESWYKVCSPDGSALMLAGFRALNSDNYYNLRLAEGKLFLYSGKETDLTIKASLSQNQRFLLKASAGNLYQHPLTGVGLIDFLHGNFENSGLAAKLQSEFEADNMIVVNAYMNSETGELLLEVKEKNG